MIQFHCDLCGKVVTRPKKIVVEDGRDKYIIKLVITFLDGSELDMCNDCVNKLLAREGRKLL
jgi:ribosome-binding protein aMBF1 (putative translation factor)